MASHPDVDVAIVIALPEELRALISLLDGYAPVDGEDGSFAFARNGYRCLATLVGEMGEAQASRVTERLIARYEPTMVVSIGIAGGLNDLAVGDVHVPVQAVQYIQDAKAVPTGASGFDIRPGAPAYRADFSLHQTVRTFEFAHPKGFAGWTAAGAADLKDLVPDPALLLDLAAQKTVRASPRVLADGHVATGPIVGAASAFTEWIREYDRNFKSIEMESAAVVLATQNRPEPRRALVIRGISDLGDQRKGELDRCGDGVLRRYAMRNAVRFLWALLDAKALRLSPPDPPVAGRR